MTSFTWEFTISYLRIMRDAPSTVATSIPINIEHVYEFRVGALDHKVETQGLEQNFFSQQYHVLTVFDLLKYNYSLMTRLSVADRTHLALRRNLRNIKATALCLTNSSYIAKFSATFFGLSSKKNASCRDILT
jgi:hypothetical protein